MIAVSSEGAWRVTTPRLDYVYTGSGDLTTATFLAHYLRTGAVDEALGKTADVVYSVLKVTKEHGRRELALVLAQDQLVDPAEHFAVVRLF